MRGDFCTVVQLIMKLQNLYVGEKRLSSTYLNNSRLRKNNSCLSKQHGFALFAKNKMLVADIFREERKAHKVTILNWE